MRRDISTSYIHSNYGVRKSKPFINGDGMRDPIPAIQHQSCGPARRIKTQNGLNGNNLINKSIMLMLLVEHRTLQVR